MADKITGQERPRHASVFTREAVADLRMEYVRPGSGLTIKKIADTYDCDIDAVQRMLCGRTYNDVPGKVAHDQVYTRTTVARFFSDSKVKSIRKKCLETNGLYGIAEVASEYGMQPESARYLLTGQSYKNVGYKVPRILIDRYPKAMPSDDDIVRLRNKYFEARGGITMAGLAARLKLPVSTVSDFIRGKTYAHLPGKVIVNYASVKKRKLTPECALFIRLTYKPGVITYKMLAAAYGVKITEIECIVKGEYYKEVPMPDPPANNFMLGRRLSIEQVKKARIDFARKTVSLKELSKQLNIGETSVRYMIYGDTYPDVPGAVPRKKIFVKKLKRYVEAETLKPRKIIKVRPVRLPDHDERVDHRNAA